METRFQQGNKDSIDLLTSESYTSTSAPHNLSWIHQHELLLRSLMSSLTIGLQPLDPVTKRLPISHPMNRTRCSNNVNANVFLVMKNLKGRQTMTWLKPSSLKLTWIKLITPKTRNVQQNLHMSNPENYTSNKLQIRTQLLPSLSCPLIKLLQEKSTSTEITEESSPQRK